MTAESPRLTISGISIACFIVLLLTTAASAQMRGGDEQRRDIRAGLGSSSMERLLRPDFHTRDMAIFARQLELDHSQRPIFEMLLEDYREAFRDATYELDRALRHRAFQRTQERMQQRLERQERRRGQAPPDDAVESAPEQVVIDGVEVTDLVENTQVRIQITGSAALRREEIEGRQVMMISTEDDPARTNAEGDADQSLMPYVRLRRNAERVETDSDDAQQRPREVTPEMQDRIDRMRERIRQRMEDRLEQQREEMRQRGIDPDEEVEPIETEEIIAAAESLLTEKRRLRERFESDAAMLLTARQREQLPQTLRIIRRLNGLPDSRLSGEQIDLVRVLDDQNLLSRQHPDLEFVLDDYSEALDAALTARMRFLERADIDQFIAREADDYDTLIELTEKEMSLRKQVRNVNEMFVEEIVEVLHEDHREAFVVAYESRAYPNVRRATLMERLLPLLTEHESLEPEQRDAVEQLQQEHASDLEAHRRETIEMLREREVAQPREMLEFTQRIREMRERGEDMRAIDWREMRPPIPAQYAATYSQFQIDQPFLARLHGIVPANKLERLADENDAIRSLVHALDRYGNYRYSGELRWEQRRGPRGGRD